MSRDELKKCTDKELIGYMQLHEPYALDVLRQRKDQDMLNKYLLRLLHYNKEEAEEAEDATRFKVQDYFYKHPGVVIKDFDPWVRTIAYHIAIDMLRDSDTIPINEELTEIKDDELTEERALEREKKIEMILVELKKLSPWRQHLVQLWLQGKSFVEIDAIEKYAEHTTSSEFNKMFKEIRQHLHIKGVVRQAHQPNRKEISKKSPVFSPVVRQ